MKSIWYFVALCLVAVNAIDVKIAMQHTGRPMITWHATPSCTAGHVVLAGSLSSGAPRVFNFSSPLQRFRLPHALAAREVYKVRVECHDARVSADKTFMINLQRGDWDPSVWVQGTNSNLFRKAFNVSHAQTASVHIAVAGYYEVFANGQQLNHDTLLDPGFSHFSVRTLYVSYFNIELQQGENVVGVMAGGGWYGMTAGYGQTPKVRLVLMGEAGQPLAFTDNSWTTRAGPVTFDSVYDGETFNASMEIPGWNRIGFSDASWAAAALVAPSVFNPEMTLRTMPAIRQNSTVLAIGITNPAAGKWVVDFGRTISGFTTVTVSGPKGGVVTMHHGEVMDHYDATRAGQVYFANLRSAKASDTYILKGNGTETYTPHFTYHGYRFVQIESWPAGSVPTVNNFIAHEFYSAVESIGSFSSSSPLLNAIHQHTVWGQANNLMSVPTDCNQRDERLGWMADAWLASQEAVANFDMYSFYQNFLMLIRDDQTDAGGIADVVPYIRYGSNPGDPSWGSAYPILLEIFYSFGDVDTVQQHYQGVADWTNFLVTSATATGLSKMYGSYGDWVPPPPAGKVPVSMTSCFSMLRSVQIMIDLSEMLGYTANNAKYKATLATLTTEYNAAWFNNATQSYGPLQSGDALALALGIAPSSTQLSLVAKITAANNHFDTGMIGLRYLFPTLTAMGRHDLALTVATQTSYPSFGYEFTNTVETGATTLWELWDAPAEGPGMNSRDHIMDGSIDGWFYDSVAGIRQTPKQLTVAIPHAHYSTVRSAKASTRTSYGDIAVAWEVTGGALCVFESQPNNLTLDCGGNGGAIQSIDFISVGQPHGVCAAYERAAGCDATLDLTHCIGRESCVVAEWWRGAAKCNMKRTRVAVRAQCSKPAALRVTVVAPFDTAVTIPVPVVSARRVNDRALLGSARSFHAVVGSGRHEWVLTGEPSTRRTSVEAGGAMSIMCPPQMSLASVSDVRAVCGAAVLLHHVETTCQGKSRCEVSMGPVLDFVPSHCMTGAIVHFECTA